MNLSFQSLASQATILIVDDTPANVGVLVDYLEDRDFRILVAQEGEEALMRAQLSQPDLILLDVMMPGIDGFETCRRFKTIDSLRDVPIIFMTALTETADKVKGFEIGGVDYVTKPFQIEEVFARVNTHLSLRLLQKKMTEQNQQLLNEIAVREQAEKSLISSNEQLREINQRMEDLHQQLLQSEKMASIGQLAAGVAHEINNPIAFVNSNLSTLDSYIRDLLEFIQKCTLVEERANLPLIFQQEIAALRDQFDIQYVSEDVSSLMTESLEGIQRVRQIVQDLKDFSHVDEVGKQVVNLHPGLDSTLNIVRSELKHKAEVVKEYGDIPDIECVPAQLNQVFLNLLVNAGHAIENHGTIKIRTGRLDDFIWIEISDTGAGISSENLKRIFEPFFTTKPIGTGTGLGLSLSYGIIKRHGGRIDVKSEVGIGTAFTIWLPIKQI
ncbi:MAG: response regulator [Pseudomonadota bacterium]